MTLSRTARSAVAVWCLMAAFTMASYWVGTDHGFDDPEAAGVVLVVLAFVKVAFVGSHFMELRVAAPVLRQVFAAYVVLVASVLITLLLVL